MIASANEAVTDEQLGAIERSACPTCGSCSGMFTANSMNCLTEAIGLALPGNGSTLATHAARTALFERGRHARSSTWPSGTTTATTTSVLPRAIATRAAFENAVALDVAMGGSTNTVLHLLAAAREAELDFARRRHRRHLPPGAVPVQGRAEHARSTTWRTCTGPAASRPSSASSTAPACCNRDVHAVHSSIAGRVAGRLGRPRRHRRRRTALELFHAAPGGVRTTEPFSTTNRWASLDTDAADGCIRDLAHAYTADGGLAILHGNLAPDGCVVKTAGVPDENLDLPRAGQGLRVAGGRRRRPSSPARSSPATSS